MNGLSKILVSIIGVLVIGFIGILLYIYWPAITGTVNGSKYYTSEDVQEAYDEGYNDGNESKTELTAQVEYYKTLVDEFLVEVESLNKELSDLSLVKTQNESTINELTTIKNENQATINRLQNTVNKNNEDIENYKTQITNLQNTTATNQNEINNLNNQISSYQTMIKQLQDTNDMNATTIASLNTQILNLNNQISELTLFSGTYTSQINTLNNRINELQASVNYYESYIASLENGEQVVATFEYDNSVYNIQIVNKGSKLSINNPVSTDYLIFNGWKVNDEFIDLSTYTIQTNTKIIADITYKYDVKFVADSSILNSQIITKDSFATIPNNPSKSGYEFDGWSLNGVDVIDNIDEIAVTENITYTAIFTKLHTVEFIYEDTTKSTQTIRNGNYATAPSIESTEYKVFNGWTVKDTVVKVGSYKIFNDTTFVANITYKYAVVFKVNSTIYNSQIIVKNNKASVPNNPFKSGYEFDGWSLNGIDIINNINTTPVTENTTYQAIFTKLYTVTFMVDDVTFCSQQVRNGNYAELPSNPTKKGYEFNGWSIDGINIISNISNITVTSDKIYIAIFTSLELNTIITKSWNGLSNFSGQWVWNDGTNIYYSAGSSQYVLDKLTSTWKPKTWYGLTNIYGYNVWTNGVDYFYSSTNKHYILDKATSTWNKITWSGYTSFTGTDVWTDGINYYVSNWSSQYVIDFENYTLIPKTWNGYNELVAQTIWTDGENIYFSRSYQMVLNVETSTWSEVNWNGLESPTGSYIWSDGVNIYYSDNSKQYILNTETKTWVEKTWAGDYMFSGTNIWTDGENWYYSSGTNQYQFIVA